MKELKKKKSKKLNYGWNQSTLPERKQTLTVNLKIKIIQQKKLWQKN